MMVAVASAPRCWLDAYDPLLVASRAEAAQAYQSVSQDDARQ